MAAQQESYKYVVLGGGNSSGYAANEFVKRGTPKGQVAIITDEPVVAYERPALSKAYLNPEGPARLPGFHTCVGGGGDKHVSEWYEENGITYKTNTHVTEANIKNHTLKTDKGDSIKYEKLIVATGARPVDMSDFGTKGADLKGLYYLRNVTDADRLIAAFPDAKAKGGKALVIGGGYIGLECSAALNKNGLDVTLVFPESRFMERLFSPEIAEFYEGYYADKGITIMRQSTVTAFEGENGHVTDAVLKDGKKIETDLVLVGVGARPNIELFKDQLELLKDKPGGIKVDGHLRTSDPDVYAIGDVAAFPLPRYGMTTRQEHVANCRQSAQHAVASILAPGEMGDYNYLPYFYSRIFDLGWQYYGVSENVEPVFFGDKAAKKFGSYFVRDGKVVGAFMEGGSNEENASLKKVAEQQPPAPSDLSELSSQGLAFASKL